MVMCILEEDACSKEEVRWMKSRLCLFSRMYFVTLASRAKHYLVW